MLLVVSSTLNCLYTNIFKLLRFLESKPNEYVCLMNYMILLVVLSTLNRRLKIFQTSTFPRVESKRVRMFNELPRM